jgi:hypothetical protein
MSFIIALIILSGMGSWVAYRLFLILRQNDAKVAEPKRKPFLYWVIFIAQMFFLMACLYKLFHEIF